MSLPSFSQIKAQVTAIRQKVSHAKVIGIRSLGRWTGEATVRDDENVYAIFQCDSPLAFRLALRQPTDEDATKVLITDLDENDLGDDVLLRLAKRRLFQIDPWRIVRSLFDAHAIDPRLTRHAWIAESLLELIPAEGYPPARGGFLDAETIWPLLLERAIGLRADSFDLPSLLRWSQNAEATALFRRCPEPFRQGATDWLTEKAGPVAALLLKCIERLDRTDALPVGLAAAVVYHPSAIGKLEKATGKLEQRFLGGESPAVEHMQRWSTAAIDVLHAHQDTERKLCHQAVQRADEILLEIQADEMAYLSDVSPIGFDQRLARVGTQLSQVLSDGSWDSLDGLLEARKLVVQHAQAAQEERRLERVNMAVRLTRWLELQHQDRKTEPQSFPDAAEGQLREGGFVDWARLSLRSGDPVSELSQAYAQLFDRVRQVRQQESQVFAKLLADWTAAGSQGDDIVPVERALDEVVAPLAAEGLVLVVVIDGMSVSVCRQLLADITRHEWTAISEPGRSFNRPGLATIPSVTEYSRMSLLCGRLARGNQNKEKTGFGEHPTLVKQSRSGSPPVLFHKARLQEQDDSVLAAEVRKEIASTHRRVVGVVVNAVDDHLLKGEQIDIRWSRDEIKVLPALLHEARIARRLVVLISDHGHVLDCEVEGRIYNDELAGGERWRAASGDVADDELQVEGSRVVANDHRLIAPWSEQVRYSVKKNGYHGGVTPQEMIIPITVLSSTDDFPEGWSEQPIDTPDWWDEPAATDNNEQQLVPQLKPMKPKPTGLLFDLEEETAESTATADDIPKWVSNLLLSPVFEDQKRLGGRGVPTDDVFRELLTALDKRGGKMTSAAIARALKFPAMRLPGLLAKAERVLNVDGYDVLRRDDASDTIELNRELLLTQFDLVEEA